MVVVVVAMAGATSTGILGLPTLLLFSSYIKYKSQKTSSNRRRLGEVENQSRSLRFITFHIDPSCGQSQPATAEPIAIQEPLRPICPVSHSFHCYSTARGEEEEPEEWITQGKPRPTRPTARSIY